ncbi:unnamed protein product [Cylicocyclus nassatus]|uniref:N-acetyltransferase domain-containing protein n=1 Tax=Cylicocyclus nassatus TaxID=53992 RepID=A0AA36H1Y9_CYLNA|nr:unnamed protein product [Cylicocyclus nassatus]
MATLVASSSSGSAPPTAAASTPTGSGSSQSSPSSPSAKTPHMAVHFPENTRVDGITSEQEVVDFLREHLIANEPILSSLRISNTKELTTLLTDIVRDCISCPASKILRDTKTQAVLGVCLASRAALFEKQMDRLFRYEFSDVKLHIAIEFFKSVFNRADVTYHLEENQVTKPVFVAIIAVHPDHWNKGIGSGLLEICLSSAREDHCDGALALCSSSRASRLMSKTFKNVVCRTRYCDYRGEYRDPPIAPPAPDSALHVLLTKL